MWRAWIAPTMAANGKPSRTGHMPLPIAKR